jgi:hypothetical protein
MALIDRIFGRNRSLTELSTQELRRQEVAISRQRERLSRRIDQLTAEKQRIFEQGAKQKSPELRRALAVDFELRTQEQLMVAREMNVRSKELLTVSRLRMVREHAQRGATRGRLNLTDADAAKLTRLIEDDAVSEEMYAERLDGILEIGAEADRSALGGGPISEAGRELLSIWEEMDKAGEAPPEAFEQADALVRRRAAAPEP